MLIKDLVVELDQGAREKVVGGFSINFFSLPTYSLPSSTQQYSAVQKKKDDLDAGQIQKLG